MSAYNNAEAPKSPFRDRRVIAVGALAGAALGAWAGQRMRSLAQEDRPQGMIDWERARSTALNMNRGQTLTATERERLDQYYGDLVQRCVPIVSEYTRSELPETDQRTFAFDRIDWINANLDGFKRMFAPIEEMDTSRPGANVAARLWSGVNQNVLSYEVGLLLGYLARRVLGQYDLALLGREPVGAGKLYYVEPNIRFLEHSLKLPKEDFRMWLALHETTHAFEFEAHPWVRVQFNDLLERYMEFMKQDVEYLKQGLRGLKTIAERARNKRGADSSWLEAVMTEEQRSLFQQMQAMMCVIEGYSNHVMNAVGKRLLPDYALISKRFEERQKQRSAAEQLFARLTGLDVKMEQYRAGERFIDEVVKQRGHDLARRVWEAPAYLPTMQEIRHPETWIARVDQMTGAVAP